MIVTPNDKSGPERTVACVNFYSVKAIDVRDSSVVEIQLWPDERDNATTLRIIGKKIGLAADIVQDFCGRELGLEQLNSKAYYPSEYKTLNDKVLTKMRDANSLRTHFAANISESV